MNIRIIRGLVEELHNHGDDGRSLFVKLYDHEDLLGTAYSLPALILSLLDEDWMIDLHDEEAGGAVPADIRGLTHFEVYRG